MTFEEIEAVLGERSAERLSRDFEQGYAALPLNALRADAIDALVIATLAGQIAASKDAHAARSRAQRCLSLMRQCFDASLEIQAEQDPPALN